jgi:hypothetical protein
MAILLVYDSVLGWLPYVGLMSTSRLRHDWSGIQFQ